MLNQYKEFLFSILGLSVAIAAWAGATDDRGQSGDRYAQRPTCSAVCLFVRYEDNRMIFVDQKEVSSDHSVPQEAFSAVKYQCALFAPPLGAEEAILVKEFFLFNLIDPRDGQGREIVRKIVPAGPFNCQPLK